MRRLLGSAPRSGEAKTLSANAVLYPSAYAPANRYPLNQNSVMIGNWVFAILFYIPPIFLPNLIWLGLMPILFGAIGQSLSANFPSASRWSWQNRAAIRPAGLSAGASRSHFAHARHLRGSTSWRLNNAGPQR